MKKGSKKAVGLFLCVAMLLSMTAPTAYATVDQSIVAIQNNGDAGGEGQGDAGSEVQGDAGGEVQGDVGGEVQGDVGGEVQGGAGGVSMIINRMITTS